MSTPQLHIPAIPFTVDMLAFHIRTPGHRWGQSFYDQLPEEFLKENNILTEGHENKFFMDIVFNERDDHTARGLIEASFALYQELQD